MTKVPQLLRYSQVPLVFYIALVHLASPAAAQADMLATDEPCSMELRVDDSVDWRGLYGRGYEVLAVTESYETVTLSILHEGSACEFFITAATLSGDGENSLQGPGDPLYYDVLQTTSGPSFLSEEYFGTATSRIEGRFAEGRGMQAATAYISIPGQQFVRGGTYNGQVIFRLFRVGADGPELEVETPLAILAPVAAVLEIESPDFAGGSRRNSIDLGDLSTESRRTIDFNLRSNANISLGFRSDNNGMLAHEAGAQGIAYTVMFRGRQIDLSGSAPSVRIEYSASQSSHSMPIEIIVPKPTGLPAAGDYDDILTVTFTVD